MNERLIVRLSCVLTLLATSACCRNNDNDCTTAELAYKRAEQAEYIKRTTVPEFVSETDGVKLYRIWTVEPQARDHWTYFTTPCGDVRATLEWTYGKGQHDDIPVNTAGSGCK